MNLKRNKVYIVSVCLSACVVVVVVFIVRCWFPTLTIFLMFSHELLYSNDQKCISISVSLTSLDTYSGQFKQNKAQYFHFIFLILLTRLCI